MLLQHSRSSKADGTEVVSSTLSLRVSPHGDLHYVVYSSRVVVQKEGAVIFFMSSVILEMLLWTLIVVVGIHGDIDNATLGHDQDQGPDLILAVRVGGHTGVRMIGVIGGGLSPQSHQHTV